MEAIAMHQADQRDDQRKVETQFFHPAYDA
jgi:hypothetical protein